MRATLTGVSRQVEQLKQAVAKEAAGLDAGGAVWLRWTTDVDLWFLDDAKQRELAGRPDEGDAERVEEIYQAATARMLRGEKPTAEKGLTFTIQQGLMAEAEARGGW